MNIKKALFCALGCLGLVLGFIGAIMPLIPAFPFLLLAAYSFARSSQRLNDWFLSTKLYRDNLEGYVSGRGMTRRTKIRVIALVTALMGFGFTMMARKGLVIPCAILAGVWVFHIVYFVKGVKTAEEPGRETSSQSDGAEVLMMQEAGTAAQEIEDLEEAC